MSDTNGFIRAYQLAAYRVQTAVAVIMGRRPDWPLIQTKHMRVGIDMSKADMKGLCDLLIAKGVFTKDEILEAVAKSATEEADAFEHLVQAEFDNPAIRLG